MVNRDSNKVDKVIEKEEYSVCAREKKERGRDKGGRGGKGREGVKMNVKELKKAKNRDNPLNFKPLSRPRANRRKIKLFIFLSYSTIDLNCR